MFGVKIDALTTAQTVDQLVNWIRNRDGRFRFVVTPNVQHSVVLQKRSDFRQAYSQAAMVVADGMPVVLASRLLGRPLPERVNGTILTYELFGAATPERPFGVYLLGAGPGVAERAAVRLRDRWPACEVVGTYSPPLGFERDLSECRKIVDQINAVSPDILVIGLGAPKQELFAARHQHELSAGVGLCVGATIDFLAGEKPLAPRWMANNGLEWLHRVVSEPRRLARRYASDAIAFPQLVYREWRNRHRTAL
jgi:N-acetylglucosaminyldiphosphoundecaprenol N-acetyl-beta-D-mannosaminyltransferase